MTRLKTPGFDALLRKVREDESCLIEVSFEGRPAGLGSFKIYVDRNVRATPAHLRDQVAPENALISVQPGAHVVQARDADQAVADRRESNAVALQLESGQRVALVLSDHEGELRLRIAG